MSEERNSIEVEIAPKIKGLENIIENFEELKAINDSVSLNDLRSLLCSLQSVNHDLGRGEINPSPLKGKMDNVINLTLDVIEKRLKKELE